MNLWFLFPAPFFPPCLVSDCVALDYHFSEKAPAFYDDGGKGDTDHNEKDYGSSQKAGLFLPSFALPSPSTLFLFNILVFFLFYFSLNSPNY
jgi:hypothetical protein